MSFGKDRCVWRFATDAEGDERDGVRVNDGAELGPRLVDRLVERELGAGRVRPVNLAGSEDGDDVFGA